MEIRRIYSDEKAVLIRLEKVETIGSILKNNGVKEGDFRSGLCLTFGFMHSKNFQTMANVMSWLDTVTNPKILGEQELVI